MTKKLWGVLAIILLLNVSMVSSAGPLEITAPGGGHLDSQQKVMNFHGSASEMIEARWKDSVPVEELSEEQSGKVTGKTQVQRILKTFELMVNYDQDYLVASNKFVFTYDQNTTASGTVLEWNQKTSWIKITGQAVILYKDWTIKSSSIEGQLDTGEFIAYGPVEAFNKLESLRGGKLLFDHRTGKATIQENPILIKGKNEMTASEMIYNLNTNQVLATGSVKSSIINESN